jgi:hypothetical protein
MKNTWIGLAAAAAIGCASYPAPAARMTDAEATARSADEVGAATDPQAQIYLRNAREEIVKARQAMDDGDNKRADFILVRAKADADLALAKAREMHAQAAAQQAQDQLTALQGNRPSTTTVTGAPAPGPKPAPPAPKKPEGDHR